MVHRITMSVDNQTPYYLNPNGEYAHWGKADSGPQTVEPYNKGSGGVFQASAIPFVGCAGISGYTIQGQDIWIEMLGSDPYRGPEPNKARVALSATLLSTNENEYRTMYYSNTTSTSLPTKNGQITIDCSIGSNDDCTATFVLTFKKGIEVPEHALGVVVPEEFKEKISQ